MSSNHRTTPPIARPTRTMAETRHAALGTPLDFSLVDPESVDFGVNLSKPERLAIISLLMQQENKESEEHIVGTRMQMEALQAIEEPKRAMEALRILVQREERQAARRNTRNQILLKIASTPETVDFGILYEQERLAVIGFLAQQDNNDSKEHIAGTCLQMEVLRAIERHAARRNAGNQILREIASTPACIHDPPTSWTGNPVAFAGALRCKFCTATVQAGDQKCPCCGQNPN